MLAGCNICAICLGSFHVILRELPFLFEEIRVMDYEIQKNIYIGAGSTHRRDVGSKCPNPRRREDFLPDGSGQSE